MTAISKGRPKKTVPSVRFGCCLSQDMHDRVDRHLFSELEGRVPHGKKSEFIESLLREYFEKIDLEVGEVEEALL